MELEISKGKKCGVIVSQGWFFEGNMLSLERYLIGSWHQIVQP